MSTALATALARLSGVEVSEDTALTLVGSGRATDVPTQRAAAHS